MQLEGGITISKQSIICTLPTKDEQNCWVMKSEWTSGVEAGWAQLITPTALTNPDLEESSLLRTMRAEQRKNDKEVEELVIVPMHMHM